MRHRPAWALRAVAGLRQADRPALFSHYVPRHGLPQQANFNLCYWIDGRERTDEFSAEAIFRSVADNFRRLGGVDGQYLTAMSAITVLENLFADEEVHVHAPGPHGLPGGYPVKVGMGQVLLGLPYGIRREEAIQINEAGQRQDGIQSIMADGTVLFGEAQMNVMEQMLGYFVANMKVQDAAECANELGRKYQAFAHTISQQGVSHVPQQRIVARQFG